MAKQSCCRCYRQIRLAALCPARLNRGLIIGVTVNEDGSKMPTIWINNEPHDRNGLVTHDDPLGHYVFTNADRVNNRGQIVASGMDPRTGLPITVLLTPTKH